MTLALPKLALAALPKVVGRIVLADIGIPAAVLSRDSLDVTRTFSTGWLVEIVYMEKWPLQVTVPDPSSRGVERE